MTDQKDQEFLSIADFFVILFRRKVLFIVCWLLIMAAAVTYLMVAEKTYRLSGTIYVGRFQGLLLEEGEFVGQKLRDYSFIKRALETANIQLDVPLDRLQRQITTEIVNEVKKNEHVGIVKLTVEFQGQQKVYEIYKALTDALIADHAKLLANSTDVFDAMEARFWESEAKLRSTMLKDEALAYEQAERGNRDIDQPASQVLVQHIASEKRYAWRDLIKDIHYLKIEADSATRSFNTKLTAEPVVPDNHFKPKGLLTLVLGAILATVAATAAALLMELYQTQVRPKLKQTA